MAAPRDRAAILRGIIGLWHSNIALLALQPARTSVASHERSNM